eukprot:CAMPEP_0178683258 /NCGR_PEP_ID=MMETSP0699-20121125/2212_1 /TAXON_ID=265572 /ORGANISM="Extubocellulus spinifer, Strain CCMP396" /LENGTH=1213 /DNA_ID=CAMNT_0020327849 /DNA_START=350 /DNA_END=3992 /DNA_ORIENTATION=+
MVRSAVLITAAVALTTQGGGTRSADAFQPTANSRGGAAPSALHVNLRRDRQDPASSSTSTATSTTTIWQHRNTLPNTASLRRYRRPLAVSASSSIPGNSDDSSSSATSSSSSSTTSTDDASTLRSIQSSALSALSSAEDWATSAASSAAAASSSDYVDEYELELQTLQARRDAAAARDDAARRRNLYEVTVPIVTSSRSSSSRRPASAAAAAGAAAAANAMAGSAAGSAGMTLRQVDGRSGQLSSAALDFDTLRLVPNLGTEEEMDPTTRDGSVEIMTADAVAAATVLGGGSGGAPGPAGSIGRKAGVVVSSVVRDGMAWRAGVRPGDLVLATSATVGQKMWPKTTLEGIRSAISSRGVMSSSIKMQLQRSVTTASTADDVAAASAAAAPSTSAAAISKDITEFELTLSRPLGINVEDGPDGYVIVTALNETASSPSNDISAVGIGDRIVAVDSSLGNQMWPVSNVAGLVSACTSRLPGQTVSLRFERVELADDDERDGGAAAGGVPYATATAVGSEAPSSSLQPANLAAVRAEGAQTRQALLSRCRDVLQKYTAQYKAQEVTPKVLLTVADKIVAALADSSVSPDAATLNLLMNAYVTCGKAEDAIRTFEASTGVSADGSSRPTDTVIESKTKPDYRIMPNLSALNLYTATNLLRAHSSRRDGFAARRVLAAMEGREDVVVNGIRAASWPRGGESVGDEDAAAAAAAAGKSDNWVTDTRCYNIVLAAASKMKSSSGLKIASDIFDSMVDPKMSKEEWAASAAGRPFRDAVTYNSMIAAYGRAGRIQDAMDMFRALKSCGLEPDKFTYTSLIKAKVESGDVDDAKSILDSMESKGVEADVFAYNSVIKGLCDKYRWYEAKELVTEMEWNGVRPDSYTYGMLMNGLIKAGKPGPALTLFETACADPRTINIAQNVQIYTTAVTAASMMGDHARALGLVSRMVGSGVKPNLKTFTSLMGGCLSSGKTSYALDIFGKISEPDGYALELGIRAFCDSGDFASATSLLTEQRDGRREMSGKQIMSSYDYTISSALKQRNYQVARDALTELINSGYIPSKKTFRAIIDALSLVPKRGQMRPQLTDDNRGEAEGAFDFMIFVLDSMEQRKLPVVGAFYAAVLFEGSRAGGLRKKVASLIAESKLSAAGGKRIDVSEAIECADEERCVGWEDILTNYQTLEGQGIALPLVRVKSDERSIRAVLTAEQKVSYGRRRRRRAAV